MTSQTPLADLLLHQNLQSEKIPLLLKWLNSTEASSPSTWNTSPKRSRNAQAEQNLNSPVKRQKRYRRPLEQTSGNIASQRDDLLMPQHDNVSAKMTQDNPRRSPRKASPSKKAQDLAHHPSTLYQSPSHPSDHDLEAPDRERTPRPRSVRAPDLRYLLPETALLPNNILPITMTSPSSQHSIFSICLADCGICNSHALILPPPTYNQNVTEMDRSESESMPSRESGSRSTSPVKKWADLSMADIPTEYEELDGHVAARLKGVLTKYRRLREIGAGVGVIPSSLKVTDTMRLQDDARFGWGWRWIVALGEELPWRWPTAFTCICLFSIWQFNQGN